MRNWIKYFMSRDHWRSPRHVTPPLVTYYWDGESAIPAAQCIQNISSTGLYLLTERRWYLGTLIILTLQTTDSTDSDENAIAVMARVIRSGADGVGFKFVFPAARNAQSLQTTDGNRMADKKTLKLFLQGLRASNASTG
jgi:PilZ domain